MCVRVSNQILSWLESYEGTGPSFYRRYVHDIFAIFENEEQANSFFNYLNNRHKNIKFTKDENLKPGELPFLDIFIKNQGELVTSVYQKKTYTGLLTNFKSFVPYSYKLKLINTLVDRIYKINNTRKGFHLDVINLTSTLCKNLFPIKLVQKVINKYLNNKNLIEQVNTDKSKNETKYFKLPYIGEFSKIAKHKLNKIVKRFCKGDIDLKLVFTATKIKDYFSQKDKIPDCFRSFVVYKFICARCNSSYVGKTHRHHTTRVKEHLYKDLNSHIFQHLQNNQECKNSCNENCFSIIDTANTQYELSIKEALHTYKMD